MTDWIEELRSALSREFGDKPNLCTLATVDRTGSPRARTVVCRRLGEDGAIYIASDGRSEKNEQVKASPHAEVVFWLGALREQYRVQGAARALAADTNDPSRAEIWRQLSDAARAMFQWPTPGARRSDAQSFAQTLAAEAAPPAAFEVIVIRPRRVEHLDLNPHPHRRRRWMLAGMWGAAAELNP